MRQPGRRSEESNLHTKLPPALNFQADSLESGASSSGGALMLLD